ncbi:MAG: Holliday junction branch migration protein RuvA [Candidatus Colwellbacteria bacterium]|nr:Holliday junction branch migration protein RuvA [Candidatus Colwellbacteria bacterium]
MIYSLSGKVALVRGNFAVLQVMGVGYKIFVIPANAEDLKEKIGSEASLFTYLYIREETSELYGFLTEGELGLFEMLVSVSGIGPKLAMGVLAVASVSQLETAIKRGESELLQRSSGIGRKMADRLIVELRDKIKSAGDDESLREMESDSDIYDAMVNLGYTSVQAKAAIRKIEPELKGLNDRLKDALKKVK